MKDKKTLITIIILLCLFMPLGILGTIKHFTKEDVKEVDDNPNKEFILNNKVYFYKDGKLLGTYKCGNCSKADTYIDDVNYHTNYYKYGESSLSGVISGYFSVFKDNNDYVLYNAQGNVVIDKYDKIKNYNLDATNNFLITHKSTGWGVVFFDLTHGSISNEYDYIALPSHMIDGKIDISNFIVKKGSSWYVLQNDGTALTTAQTSEIVDFNTKYYITYDGKYHIYDYKNIEYLDNFPKSNVFGLGDYLFILNDKQLLIYKDVQEAVLKVIKLNDYETIYFSSGNGKVNIITDGNLFQSLALS